jgi:hypothetical protein
MDNIFNMLLDDVSLPTATPWDKNFPPVNVLLHPDSQSIQLTIPNKCIFQTYPFIIIFRFK